MRHTINLRRTTRSMGMVSAAAVVTLALAACGGTDTESSTSDTTEAGATADGITLEVWDYLGQGVSHTAMESAVEAFEAANPGITVNRTSFAYSDLATSIVQGGVGGSVPDVAIVDVVDTQNFASLGLLQDVTDAVGERSGEYFDGPWQSTQIDGKTYGLPLNSNNLALYYNKDVFEAAGAEVPTTWDELRTTGLELSSAENTGIAMSGVKNEQGTFQFLPFLWQTGGDLDTFATDGATALQYLKDLIDD